MVASEVSAETLSPSLVKRFGIAVGIFLTAPAAEIITTKSMSAYTGLPELYKDNVLGYSFNPVEIVLAACLAAITLGSSKATAKSAHILGGAITAFLGITIAIAQDEINPAKAESAPSLSIAFEHGQNAMKLECPTEGHQLVELAPDTTGQRYFVCRKP